MRSCTAVPGKICGMVFAGESRIQKVIPVLLLIFNVVEYLVKAVHAECLETIIEIVTAPRPEEISKEFVGASHSDLVCSEPVFTKPPKMTHDVVVSILWR